MNVATSDDHSIVIDFTVARHVSDITTKDLESLVHHVLHKLTAITVGNHNFFDFIDVTDLAKIILVHFLSFIKMTLYYLTLFFLSKPFVRTWSLLRFWRCKWHLLRINRDDKARFIVINNL